LAPALASAAFADFCSALSSGAAAAGGAGGGGGGRRARADGRGLGAGRRAGGGWDGERRGGAGLFRDFPGMVVMIKKVK